MGIFSSHLGFESALSKDNWTLTRSLNAENSPYYETGARLTYEVGPKLTLTGLVLNGWQNIRETNQAKALGTQLQWKPTAKVLINSSTFYGNEQPDGLAHPPPLFPRFLHHLRRHRAREPGAGIRRGQAAKRQPPGNTTPGTRRRLLSSTSWPTSVSTTLRGEYYYAERGVIIKAALPRLPATPISAWPAARSTSTTPPRQRGWCGVEGRYLNGPRGVFARTDNPGNRSYGNVTTSIALSF